MLVQDFSQKLAECPFGNIVKNLKWSEESFLSENHDLEGNHKINACKCLVKCGVCVCVCFASKAMNKAPMFDNVYRFKTNSNNSCAV